LGSEPSFPGSLDHAGRAPDAEILLLLLAAVGGQAREVGLDQRAQAIKIDHADDHEQEVAGIAEPVLVERERLVGVDLGDVGRLGWLAARGVLEQRRLALDRELDLGDALAIAELIGEVAAPHGDRAVVLARVGHLEVDELEHGLGVASLRGGLDRFGGVLDRCRCRSRSVVRPVRSTTDRTGGDRRTRRYRRQGCGSTTMTIGALVASDA
jgi:hypothetical protein